MIQFNKLELQNFLSFEGKHEFSFASQGMHWIRGINLDDSNEDIKRSVGSGKSSFLTAPEYALFGTVKKKGKDRKKDSIINKKAKKNMMVALEFIINDKEEYRIERYRKHSIHKDSLLFFRKSKDEWENLSQTEVKATQELILSKIILNHDTFLKSVLLTRDDINQFLSLSTGDRGRMFDNFVQLNKMKKYLKLCKTQRRELNKKNESLKIDIASLVKHNKSLQNLISDEEDEYKSLIKKNDKDKKKLKKEIQILNDRQKENISIEKATLTYDLAKQLKVKSIEIDSMMSNNIENQDEINTGNNKIKLCQKKINQGISKIEKSESKISKLQLNIKKTTEKLNNLQPITCNNCGAIQNSDDFEEQKKELVTKTIQLNDDIKIEKEYINEYKKENEEFAKEIKEYEIENKEYQKIIDDIEKAKIIIDQEYDALFKQMQEIAINQEIKNTIIQDAENDEPNSILDKLNNIQSEIDILNNQLVGLKISDEPLKNIEKFQKIIDENKANLIELNLDKDQTNKTLELLAFWIEGLDFKNESSIKQYCISKIIPVFNSVLHSNLSKVFGGSVVIAFDQFFEDVIMYNDEEYDYIDFSTGETSKVDLSLNLSLFDMAKINLLGTSVIFIDEIFTNVDEPTILSFLNLIREKYSKDSAVYVISHQPAVRDNIEAESITNIIKEDGVSRIITGQIDE